MTISFKIPAERYWNKAFLDQNLGLFFGKMWQLDKFEGADNKYDNSF